MSKVEFALRVKQALHDLPPEVKKLLDELDVPNAPTPQPTKDEDGRDEVEWHTGRFLCTQSRGLTESASLYGFDDDESRSGVAFFFDFESFVPRSGGGYRKIT